MEVEAGGGGAELLEVLDGLRGAEGVLEGDAFGELDAAQEFVEVDVTLFVAGYLGSDAVVGDRAMTMS